MKTPMGSATPRQSANGGDLVWWNGTVGHHLAGKLDRLNDYRRQSGTWALIRDAVEFDGNWKPVAVYDLVAVSNYSTGFETTDHGSFIIITGDHVYQGTDGKQYVSLSGAVPSDQQKAADVLGRARRAVPTTPTSPLESDDDGLPF